MRFDTIRYLTFARRALDEDPAEFGIASSGMEYATAADIGLDPPVVLRVDMMYPGGHPGLRARIADMAGVATERVLLAQGTSLANFLVVAALLREGDAALCERPAYEPLWRVLETLGARVELFDRPEERAFVPDLDAIRRGLEAGARLVVLSDLHNPSGTLLERDLVREIGALARRYDAWLLVDEVYLPAVFDRAVAGAATLGEERIVATASLTKAFGLGPLRAGWAIAPPDVVRRAIEVNDYLGVEAPCIAEEATLRALDRLDALRARARARREENWPIVRDFLRERGLAYTEPAGGFMVWVKLPPGVDADFLAETLRAKHQTQVMPGSFFGAADHIRVGYGGPAEKLREGLRRLGAVLSHGAPDPIRDERRH